MGRNGASMRSPSVVCPFAPFIPPPKAAGVVTGVFRKTDYRRNYECSQDQCPLFVTRVTVRTWEMSFDSKLVYAILFAL